MNVAFDPWIPVVTTEGARTLASLNSVLTEGEKFADLAVRPHERVALMRLLLCVAHAALDGPRDYDDWCEVPKRLPASAQAYLTEWKDSFELFHKQKPWLQVAGLSKNPRDMGASCDSDEWTPTSKLNFSFATGNNSTLFDHEGATDNRTIPLNETIVSMISFQNFSVGGLIGQVFWEGTRCGELANPNKENGPVKSVDGPCVPSSMMHALLRGGSLLQTIQINLPTYDDIRLYYGEDGLGKPLWEMMPTSLSDTKPSENATKTYIGRLVPMTRSLKLDSSGEKMLIGDGLAYPVFPRFPQEPTASVIIKNDERSLLSYRPTKAIWRELSALIVKRSAEGTGGPLSLRAIQDGHGFDLIVAALARDKATIIDSNEAVFNISSRLNTLNGTVIYQEEVRFAEALANRLGWAIETYRIEIDGGWEGRLKGAGPSKGALKEKLRSIATSRYWTTVEKKLPLLMTHIEANGTDNAISTREAWRKMLFAAACDAYRTACGQETSRQVKAFAKGWQKLTTKKDEPDAEVNESKEEEV